MIINKGDKNMGKFELVCQCGEVIKEISTMTESKHRTDFKLSNDKISSNINITELRGNSINQTHLLNVDREYYATKVTMLIFNCSQCGTVSTDDSSINDFIRDSQFIFEDDLKHDCYGKVLHKENIIIQYCIPEPRPGYIQFAHGWGDEYKKCIGRVYNTNKVNPEEGMWFIGCVTQEGATQQISYSDAKDIEYIMEE